VAQQERQLANNASISKRLVIVLFMLPVHFVGRIDTLSQSVIEKMVLLIKTISSLKR